MTEYSLIIISAFITYKYDQNTPTRLHRWDFFFLILYEKIFTALATNSKGLRYKKSTRKLLNSRCFTRRIANNAGLTLGKPAVVIRTNHSPNFKYLIPVINSKKRDFCSEPIPFIVQNIFYVPSKNFTI